MIRVYAIAALVLLGTLFGAYQYGKSQANTIVQIQEQEKIVEKRDVVTVVKEVVRPDGTKETVTTTEDKSVVNTKREKEVITKKADWFVAAGVTYDREYSFEVNRRVLGDIFVGAFGTTDQQVGVKIGIEF